MVSGTGSRQAVAAEPPAAVSGSCDSSSIVQAQPPAVWPGIPSEPLSWTQSVQACGQSVQAAGQAQAPVSTGSGSGIIDTIAGGGIGDGGPGLKAELFLPSYDIFDAAGNLYVSTQGRVVKIDPSGVATTFVGTGTISFRPKGVYYGDGGPATRANFGNGGPAGLAFDSQGDLYIADIYNGVIRKVDTNGIISTVAGGGPIARYGIEGDDPRNVYLWGPDGIAVDRAGNLFIADGGFCTVREVKASDGKIYTVAGIPPGPFTVRSATCRYTADGVPALGSGLFEPHDVKVDASGDLFIADIGNSRIREVDTNGIIHTVAGNGSATDSGDGGPATQAGVPYPWHIALDGSGALYIVEYFNQKVRKVDAGGVITTFAGTGAEGFGGDGGPAAQATLEYPLGVAAASGNVVIADFGDNRVRRVDAAGNIETLAGNGLPPRVCTSPNQCGYSGDGYAGDGLPARSATLSNPLGVVRDRAGNTFVADTVNNRIREVDAATGIIHTVVGTGEVGSSGDGGPATSARIASPAAMAVDSQGRLYLAQGGVIRMVDTSGVITRFAGSGAGGFCGDGGPATAACLFVVTGLAFDARGNLYLSDAGNSRIRRIDTQGIISTIAGNGTRGFGGDGGAATAAELSSPWGLAVDPAGNLYIADAGNGRIRKVDTSGTITTVAGDGASGYDGDGGAATSTALSYPTGVAVATGGDVFVADQGNCLVREVAAATGRIHAVAGIPLAYPTTNPGYLNCDFTGDGGPSTDAYTFVPSGLWLDPNGTLLFADTVNNRIRAVRGLDLSPSAAMTAPSDTFQTATTFPVGWQGKDTDGSIASYTVRYRQATWNGAFGPYQTWKSGTTATQASFTGTPGITYCFSVQSTDNSGRVSAWSPEACTALPLDDRSLVPAGKWSALGGRSFYLGTAMSSKTAGASLSTPGPAGVLRIALLAETCKGCGSVNVYLGSTLLGTFSLNTPTKNDRVLLPVGAFSSVRRDTVKVVVAGPGKGAVIDGVGLFSAGVAPAPPAATFNPNLLLKGSSNVAEPSIRTDRFGRSFVIGPTGVPAGCKAFRVSHDGSASSFLGYPDGTAGGGDCDFAIGPQESSTLPGFGTPSDDDLAYSSLSGANITVGKSNDGGTTFGPPNPAAAQVFGDDRMWQAADPKLNPGGFDTVYMTYHDVAGPGNVEVSISMDGGQTYVQSGPLITDVTVAQWAGDLAGNELGNIVARRDPVTGALTLYSIFQTPDSAADNATQAKNGTANFNRVYEAVGIVTDVPYPGVPAVVWHDYEIYHGPIGARYNKLFPVTVVDSAGTVYAIWTDGKNILYKTDATGAGWDPAAEPAAIPDSFGLSTTLMPWAAAGSSGKVDLVFYGATGGAAGNNDDSKNSWNAYLAQTIDGGATWGVYRASDHVVHSGSICISGLNCNLFGGDRTLLDFFQVSIDPSNGAADIAYADDHAAPGNAVVYFTRQCTGLSATTGASLVNDCVAPPPPPPAPQGTTCPGPQIADFTGDAPDNYPGGSGQNMDNLDLANGYFGSSTGSANVDATLTIKDLEAPPTAQDANITSGLWAVYWQQAGTANAPGGSTWWFAQASTTGAGGNAVVNFSDGTFNASANAYSGRHAITGEFHPGPNGTIVFHVPRADIGSPADGATLTNTFADTAGAYLVLGTGLRYLARGDRAPDSSYGADYKVAQTCP